MKTDNYILLCTHMVRITKGMHEVGSGYLPVKVRLVVESHRFDLEAEGQHMQSTRSDSLILSRPLWLQKYAVMVNHFIWKMKSRDNLEVHGKGIFF